MSGDINEFQPTKDMKPSEEICCSGACSCKRTQRTHYLSDTDSNDSDAYLLAENRVVYRKCNKLLPPIGVFWDIENCRIPKGRSALSVAQLIREMFFNGYREAEFIVVCDIKKESSTIIQELSDAQVHNSFE